MAQLGLVLLGAALSLVGTMSVETWNLRRAARSVAAMIARELEFHRQRLEMAMALDDHPTATYDLKFGSPVWSSHAAVLMAGVPMKDAEPILNWYATMTVVGFSLGRQFGPDGPMTIGPDRASLAELLDAAHSSARGLANRQAFFRRRQLEPSLAVFQAPPGHGPDRDAGEAASGHGSRHGQ